MTEFYTVKRIDNSRLVRPVAPGRWRECGRRVALSGALASCVMFYAWQHFQCIQMRYHVEDLQNRRARAVQLNQQLHLEVASLRSPMRIDSIARQQLGLIVPVPGQVAPAQGDGQATVAQARVAPRLAQP